MFPNPLQRHGMSSRSAKSVVVPLSTDICSDQSSYTWCVNQVIWTHSRIMSLEEQYRSPRLQSRERMNGRVCHQPSVLYVLKILWGSITSSRPWIARLRHELQRYPLDRECRLSKRSKFTTPIRHSRKRNLIHDTTRSFFSAISRKGAPVNLRSICGVQNKAPNPLAGHLKRNATKVKAKAKDNGAEQDTKAFGTLCPAQNKAMIVANRRLLQMPALDLRHGQQLTAIRLSNLPPRPKCLLALVPIADFPHSYNLPQKSAIQKHILLAYPTQPSQSNELIANLPRIFAARCMKALPSAAGQHGQSTNFPGIQQNSSEFMRIPPSSLFALQTEPRAD
ncbi:hypothetical protein NA56DRAFT_711073 [Hyaloscypha hepaticicola]|uniref:Uncharacterized protein n=1 Tax=Hyaloscypha hepaticicola TaxID=2082293 RepID=A0A2J6PJN2_9HELO|nr:hypothetical protein NA56DRAFT_711073 [Hyaloscypha hepaticicola]